jgi:hypothetical protein
LWQVPVGNQVYQTENNSPGHTQDNKATYILSHLAAFAQAGIVGVLFGPGNGGTTATDGRRDGITNSAPINSYQCARCNTQVSVYADDDGGYLRLQLGQYYTHGAYPLPGASGGTPPPAPSPRPPTGCTPKISFGAGSATPPAPTRGASVSFGETLTASCATSGLIDFEVYNAAGQKVWQTWQDNTALTGAAQTVTAKWAIPAGQSTGAYTLRIGVFATGWSAFWAWNGHAASFSVS